MIPDDFAKDFTLAITQMRMHPHRHAILPPGVCNVFQVFTWKRWDPIVVAKATSFVGNSPHEPSCR
jgi:hypothetical protein